MASSSASRRYAQAVLDIAQQKGTLGQWQRDLEALQQITADPRLNAFLLNPRYDFGTKRRILADRLDQAVGGEAVNLILLLIQRNRLELLPGIVEEYRRLSNERLGITDATVTTAVELDDAERRQVAEQLAKITGKQVNIRTEVDPAIMGGLIARVGEQVIDGSTRTRLLALKRSLAGVAR